MATSIAAQPPATISPPLSDREYTPARSADSLKVRVEVAAMVLLSRERGRPKGLLRAPESEGRSEPECGWRRPGRQWWTMPQGSGLVARDTGVILNNSASQFATRRGHPNALAQSRRPRHTMLPGMTLRNGVPNFMIGSIGLNNHPQRQAQMLVNSLEVGMNPQQAVGVALGW